MSKDQGNLKERVLELLKADPGQDVKSMASQLEINRTYLSGYLEGMLEQGLVREKRIGPAKIYFKVNNKK